MALYFECRMKETHSFRLFFWRLCPLGCSETLVIAV